MSHAFDTIVVGGGVIGSAISWELACRGQKVALLERDRIGAGASSVAAGMLAAQSEADADDDWFRLLLAARMLHAETAERLRDEAGMDVEYRRDGVLRAALTEHEAAELHGRAAWQRPNNLRVEWLTPAEAGSLEPALSPDIAGALWLPDEAQVRADRLTQAVAVAARRRGVVIHEGTPVSAVAPHTVHTAAGAFHAENLVLATGPWSLAPELPLTAIKGEILTAVAGPGPFPRHIVWGSGSYLAPKPGDRLVIGATEEPDCYDTRPTLGGIQRLIAAGTRLVPSLATMPLEIARAGLRPATPDRKPVLGALPGHDRTYVAVGPYRNGILLGPLTGRLMAQLILGEEPDHDLRAYSPARFGVAGGDPHPNPLPKGEGTLAPV